MIKSSITERIPATTLGLFRIAFCTVLLLEVAQLFYFRDLVLQADSPLRLAPVPLGLLFVVWFGALLAMIVGWKTRIAAIVNYVFVLCTFSIFGRWEYHFDYVVIGVSLLLVLAPTTRRFSIDRCLAARAGRPMAGDVSRLWTLAIVFIGVGLVYFDSVFHKLNSDLWTAGLGVWLPASRPWATWLPVGLVQTFLDWEWIVRGLGFATLAFEMSFVFLLWFARARPLLLFVGVGLHIGIALVFPIPWFGLGEAALYLLLLPAVVDGPLLALDAALVRRLGARAEPPQQQSSRGFELLLPVALALTALIGQSLYIVYKSPVGGRIARSVLPADVLQAGAPFARVAMKQLRHYAGLSEHPVFMDGHFAGYEHIVGVVAVDAAGHDTWLPMIDEHGQPGAYATGRQWVNWSFRVVRPGVKPEAVSAGIEQYSKFWAEAEGRDLNDLKLELRVKKVPAPSHWQSGALREALERPWQTVAVGGWRNGVFSMNVPDIEAL
jgi:hypothetical protein